MYDTVNDKFKEMSINKELTVMFITHASYMNYLTSSIFNLRNL